MEWIIFGVIALVIIGAIFKPRSCDVCGADFKKKYFTWKIDGKKQHLCPYCNSKMNRRNSDRQFKNKFG
ncbi:TPA: hypothetical protein ACPZLH_001571 [Yersinia enterocolitica]